MSTTVVQPHKSSIGNLDANVMALIAYLASAILSWIPGIQYIAWLAPLVIFFIEKDSGFVRFHAMQAFVLNAISTILFIIISVFIGGLIAATLTGVAGIYAAVGAMGFIALITTLVGIAFTVFAIIALIQAYQYKQYRIPLVGGLTDKVASLLGGAR